MATNRRRSARVAAIVTVGVVVAAGPVPAGAAAAQPGVGPSDATAAAADVLPPPWNGWTPLGGKIVSEMSAVSTTGGLNPTVYVFGRGSTNLLYYNRFLGAGWAGWQPLIGAQIGGDPSAVAWGARIDVFARGLGADRNVYRWSFNGTNWSSGPQSLGCCIADTGSPAAVVVPSGGLNVLIRGTNDRLYHNRYDGFAWLGWQLVPGPAVAGNPTAVFGGFDIDVFARTTGAGVDQHVFRWTDNGAAWAVQDLGCCIHPAGSPSAVARTFDHLEVVIRGTNNNVYARRLTGATWTPWQQVAGPVDVTADPAPVARGGNIELFARASTGGTLRSTWQLGAWSPWQDLHGTAANRSPAAVTRQPNGPVHVFVSAQQDDAPYTRTT